MSAKIAALQKKMTKTPQQLTLHRRINSDRCVCIKALLCVLGRLGDSISCLALVQQKVRIH